MKYHISDPKIKIIIEELGEEYKDLLVEKVLSDTNEIDVDEMNPSNLIKADVAAKNSLVVDKKMYKRQRLFLMTSVVGIIYAIFGLFLLMYRQLESSIAYDPILMISVISIFIGLLAAVIPLFMRPLLSGKNPYNKTSTQYTKYEIINKWKEIEALINQLTPHHETMSLSSMIDNLKETKILDDEDIKNIKLLMNMRNEIVHGEIYDESDLPQSIKKTIKDSEALIAKMRKWV